MDSRKTVLVNGNEAVARAALDLGVTLGIGYPGTGKHQESTHAV